ICHPVQAKYREAWHQEKTKYSLVDTPTLATAREVIASDALYKKDFNKSKTKFHLPVDMLQFELLGLSQLVAIFVLVALTLISPPLQKLYKAEFEKEKGKSKYNKMIVPPDVQHAMDVAKSQSSFAYKKDAKASLHYTSVADRPDIKKATQAAKLISETLCVMTWMVLSSLQSLFAYRYKKKFEESKGHYHMIPDTPEQLHHKEASELQSNVKWPKNV
uniref:Uncharacterized protein n=1 Tax=Myripristis murdjan TaxID=586833 RepID=A0A668A059_9TELE